MKFPIILLQTKIGTNLDLDAFKFRASEGSVANQFVLLAILGVIIFLAVVLMIVYLRQRSRLNELAHAREETRFKLLLSEINLGPEGRKLIETLTESDDPGVNVILLESREAFEETIARFVAAYPDDAAVKQAPALRQRMGYGFGNPRYPFDNTRMLLPGGKMRCRIRIGGREHSFVTIILAVTERQFFLRAPTSRGKPVPMDGIPDAILRISRSDDAEYEFVSNLLGLTQTKPPAMIFDHATEISKLLFRLAPRIAVSVATQFYVIRQEIAAERSHFKFKAQESQYALQGELKDISLGGAMVELVVTNTAPQEGDVIVFRLPEAQIKEDVVAQVVGTSSNSDHSLTTHLQFAGMNELNRLKLNKFIQIVEHSAPAPQPVQESPSTPAS